ncbi:DUF4188 domain-containing protein [Streptomyces sp. HSW2009]|uniref:DUF4188 domain-containing protein n=1 Tax=Streptomyces sp. HSW2009 TaxID=3142890 RepID=UPI0032EC4CED
MASNGAHIGPIPGRVTADAHGDLVVFLIGMRFNRFSAINAWLPVLRAMPRMLRELSTDESGLLGHRTLIDPPRGIHLVQYWQSMEKLLAYAANPSQEHHPAWAAFQRRVRTSRGRVGMWHETYQVRAGCYESVYVDMPLHGLGEVAGVVPVTSRRNRAAQRLGR